MIFYIYVVIIMLKGVIIEMKRKINKTMCLILTVVLMLGSTVVSAFASQGYSDVPQNSWALDSISQAKEYGLMKGQETNSFGYGKTVTKAEFATILCNMLKWNTVTPTAPSFQDVNQSAWYYASVETALANNVMDKSTTFMPEEAIERVEMAEMFVRALGLSAVAKTAEKLDIPFTDVTSSKGYIGVAYDIGMINGTSSNTFSPNATAKREEAAAMLTRVYSKYNGDIEFLHGFYAISSYSQKELTNKMDAVTFGWSTMTLNDKGAWLNTGDSNSNTYKIPTGYEDIAAYVKQNGTKAHLGVYMDSSGNVKELLTSSANRTAAVNGIVEELTKNYEKLGNNPYSGVTIDFEGLKGTETKKAFNDFLTELSAKLKPLNKTIYVAVQPVLAGGAYYDGFDYNTIGKLADKVILMAHDYNPTSLAGYVGTEWHKNAALTPIDQVYYSLKAITAPGTGVEDKSKILLAISFAAVGWELSEDGKLLSTQPVKGDSQAVASYLNATGTVKSFSETYRNPYITYKTKEKKNIFLWYEDQQSVSEKAALARLFGIDGVSLWRLGNIPNYPGYDVTGMIK